MANPVVAAFGRQAVSGIIGQGLQSQNPLGRGASQAGNSILPNNINTYGEAISLYSKGHISFAWFKEIMLLNGCRVNLDFLDRFAYSFNGNKLTHIPRPFPVELGQFEPLIWNEAWIPPASMLIELKFKGYISDDTFQMLMSRNNISDPSLTKLIVEQSKFIPPVQDLIRFAIREVFNPPLRQSLNLDAEYGDNPDFAAWAASQGLGPVSINTPNGISLQRDFAKDYWAAHWQLPSPGQMFDMLHRLRPNRVARFANILPGLQPFTFADLQSGLKSNDYAPVWRDKLAAISYRVPTRVDVRRMLMLGVINKVEAVELYQDMGYDLTSAQRLGDFAEQQSLSKLSIAQVQKLLASGKINQAVASQYIRAKGFSADETNWLLSASSKLPGISTLGRLARKGIITQALYNDYASKLGYDLTASRWLYTEATRQPSSNSVVVARSKISEALAVGYIDSDAAVRLLEDTGLTHADAILASNAVKLEIQVARAKKAIAGVRKAFLRGIATEAQARGSLSQIGITAGAIDYYLGLWQIEFTSERKQLSAQNVMDALVRGLINLDTARQRLTNLNYDPGSIDVFLATAGQNAQKAAAMAALKASRTVAEQQRAAKAVIREQEAAAAKARRELASHGSPSQLRAWLTRGLVGANDVTTRLTALGWPPDDIGRIIAEAAQLANEKGRKPI